MAKKKSIRGESKATTIALRIAPKLRYLTELAARKQRRTLSSFVEWAVERALEQVDSGQGNLSFLQVADELWDVDEPDRFLRLALGFPELMTYDEEKLWKLVKENAAVWKVVTTRDGEPNFYPNSLQNAQLPVLKEYWDRFVAVSEGKADPDVLPKFFPEKSVSQKSN